MREKQDFRDNLERIDNAFPNKECLNISDVASFTGFTRNKVANIWSNELVKKGKSKFISKVTLARLLCP